MPIPRTRRPLISPEAEIPSSQESSLGIATPLFVHSYLDERGLDVYEFRVFAHIVRRVGSKLDGTFFASLPKSASICQMSLRKLQYSLKVLCKAGFIEKIPSEIKTDSYRILPPERWAGATEIEEIRSQVYKRKKSKADEETALDTDINEEKN